MGYKKELREFFEFRKNYKFKQLEIIKDDKGDLYCEGILLKDNNGYIGESDKWINIGYSLYGIFPKVLSNLFHYEFKFKGCKLNSIESFFQGIKFPNKKIQRKVFKYSGKDAVVIQKGTDYNWKETGIIYWQGKPIVRNSEEYDKLLVELYVSAIQNIFYRNAIRNCKLPIIHAMGEDDPNKTVFTRYEFESMLNCLRDFLNK